MRDCRWEGRREERREGKEGGRKEGWKEAGERREGGEERKTVSDEREIGI